MITFYFSASLITIGFCLLVQLIFRKMEIVDKPDGINKVHKGDISLGGGLALFLSGSLIFLVFPEYLMDVNNYIVTKELSTFWNVSIIILILGLLDDIKPLPVSIRIIVQVLASWLVIILTDIYVEDLGNLFGLGNLYLGELGIPVTIFMVVGLCNAFNMLDGMDGLIACVTLVASTSVAILVSIFNATSLGFLVTTCLIIFLIFNLGFFGKRLKIFLGDSGSMWLGFMVAWLLVSLSQGEGKIFTPVTALWLVLLPLIDALSTFLSRLWNKKQIFSGDRTHIHHILLDSGLKEWKVLSIFILISIVSAGFGIYSVFYLISEFYLFYGFLTLWFFYFLVIKYPYVEKTDL